MSRIEAEARELLLERRRMLRRPAVQERDGDPAIDWVEDELALESLSEGVRQELAGIDAALLRIEKGGYGQCLHCGGPIGLQRLRAIPEAKYCLRCSSQGMASE